MSLQGTLETIPLPDVLALLAATKKSGELRITGPRGEGRLWLDAGLVVGADVPRAASAVDAVFELLRLTSGSFTFGAGSPPGRAGEPQAIDVLLSEASGRLQAWQAIEAVVPSMACTLRLTPELGPEHVTVSRLQWKQLVAVAGAGDVSTVMKSLGLGEYETCRTVKELVEAGLVQVGKAPATPARSVEPPRVTRTTTPTPAAAPAPAPRPAPAPPSPRTASAPTASRPTSAAPAVAANGGRSAAPRRGPAGAAPGDVADELVQQLSSLGDDTGKRASGGSAPAKGKRAAPDTADDEEGGDGNGDEPINRGMLLKFLSSVRP